MLATDGAFAESESGSEGADVRWLPAPAATEHDLAQSCGLSSAASAAWTRTPTTPTTRVPVACSFRLRARNASQPRQRHCGHSRSPRNGDRLGRKIVELNSQRLEKKITLEDLLQNLDLDAPKAK